MLKTLILIFSFFILIGCSSLFVQPIQTHKVTENSLKQYPTTLLCKILKEEPNYEVQSIVVSELEQRQKKCEG